MGRVYKRPESVLVVVYAATTGQILVLQRRDDPLFWQSVTGSMTEEEREPITAAKRELSEETGLSSAQGTLYDCHYQEWFDIYPQWLFRYRPGVTQNLEHVFCFEVAAPIPILMSHEHISYDWVEKAAALKKVTSTTNRQAIAKFVP